MAHNDSFDEPRFEALYRKLYPDLLRCAEIALRTGGSWYVSVAGRAEEVVQELFAFAWEHQADLQIFGAAPRPRDGCTGSCAIRSWSS